MDLLAKIESPTLLTLGALVLCITMLLWRSHRYAARGRRSRSSIAGRPPAEPQDQGHHLGAPDEMLHWEVDMHETARDLSAQLDSKMGTLEHLIREADRVAARLESALEAAQPRHDRAPAPNPRSKPACAAVSSTSAEPLKTVGMPQPRPGARDSQPGDQAEALKSVGALGPNSGARGAADAQTEGRAAGDRRYDEVYLLADYGFDPHAIAHRVGSPVGEVELILGLREKR